MKKILFTLLLAIACMGCTRRASSEDAINGTHYISTTCEYIVVNHDGHEYLVFRVPYGVSVIHSESCQCKQKK